MILNLLKHILKSPIKKAFSSSTVMMPADFDGVPIGQVLSVLERYAPLKFSENWDNTGLLVEPYTPRFIKNVLLTNDLTEDVAIEAKNLECQMIISYHPPIFAPLKSVLQKSWKEKIVSFLLENRIYLYSPHTSWDSMPGGINDWLASPFLKNDMDSKPICPSTDPDYGAGRILKLKKGVTLSEAISRIKTLTKLEHVRFALGKGKTLNDEIKSVAVCAGSGASVLKGVPAELYITGEMLHHDVLDATQKGTSVILTNHSDSERGYLNVFSIQLEMRLEYELKVFVSKCDKDPLVTV